MNESQFYFGLSYLLFNANLLDTLQKYQYLNIPTILQFDTGGLLNDWVGRKPVITLASLIFTAGSLCLALAENRGMLIVGRLIVGAGIGE